MELRRFSAKLSFVFIAVNDLAFPDQKTIFLQKHLLQSCENRKYVACLEQIRATDKSLGVSALTLKSQLSRVHSWENATESRWPEHENNGDLFLKKSLKLYHQSLSRGGRKRSRSANIRNCNAEIQQILWKLMKRPMAWKNEGSRNLIEHDLTLESNYFRTFDLSSLNFSCDCFDSTLASINLSFVQKSILPRPKVAKSDETFWNWDMKRSQCKERGNIWIYIKQNEEFWFASNILDPLSSISPWPPPPRPSLWHPPPCPPPRPPLPWPPSPPQPPPKWKVLIRFKIQAPPQLLLALQRWPPNFSIEERRWGKMHFGIW